MGYEVRLHAGFRETPVYYVADPEETTDHEIDEAAEDLRLGPDLVRELVVWDEEFQATYNADVPQDSDFSSPAQEGAWLERGRRLAARIHQESPVVTSVEYRGYGAIPSGAVVFADQ